MNTEDPKAAYSPPAPPVGDCLICPHPPGFCTTSCRLSEGAAPPLVGAVAGQGLVLLTAEQRAHLKALAEAATPGPWRAPLSGCLVVAGPLLAAARMVADTDLGTSTSVADGAYIAALSPDVALGTLAYIEQLEATNAALASQLQEAEAARTEARLQLGSLYAHLFGDGGHRQAELEGQLVPATDLLTGEPTGEMVPALPAAAEQALYDLRARLTTEQQAAADTEREKLELYMALWEAKDALASCYNVTDWPGDGTGTQAEALAKAKALLHKVLYAKPDLAASPVGSTAGEGEAL